MRKRIFISYASLDRKIALTICSALELRGLKCWISCRDIHAGENYQEMIVRAIRDAGAMLLVFSANANNSDEIKKEIALASRGRLMVIPVRAEDVVPSEAFSYELATRQWVDLFDNWEQAMEELASQIEQVLPSDGAAMALDQQKPEAVRSGPIQQENPLKVPVRKTVTSRKSWLIGGIAVVGGLLVMIYVPLLAGPLVLLGLLGAAIYWWRKSKSAAETPVN